MYVCLYIYIYIYIYIRTCVHITYAHGMYTLVDWFWRQIAGLPGADLLGVGERMLCSTHRILPVEFLTAKEAMVSTVVLQVYV